MRTTPTRGAGSGGATQAARGGTYLADVDALYARQRGNPIGARMLRFVLAIAAVAAFVAIGTNTSVAAIPSDACNRADVIAKALPAIVNITVVRVTGSHDDSELEANAGKPASASAKLDVSSAKPDDVEISIFVGSGAVVDPSGLIVTNKHVIQDAAVIKVTFSDKRQVSARLVAAAALVDLAVLKVNAVEPLPALRFGDSDALRLGQPVIAVGNPLGIGTSVSTGVVSGLDRDLMRTPFDDFIQTDAAINPGNSGGPLLDCAGDIIGIDTALYSNSKVLGSIGIGFALPSNTAKFVTDKLVDGETIRPNWIGLHLQDFTAQLMTVFGRPNMDGAIVTGVDPGSPAANAKLKPGDVIVGVDGRILPDSRAILRTVVMKRSGEQIELSVWRHSQMSDVTLPGQPWPHMAALRSEVLASAATVARAQALGFGMHLTSITAADRDRFGLADGESGVLVDRVTAGSHAEAMGLHPGDVIEQVCDRPATTPEEVMGLLTADGNATASNFVALLVRGKASTRWVTLYVGRIDVADLVAAPPSAGPGTPRDAGAVR